METADFAAGRQGALSFTLGFTLGFTPSADPLSGDPAQTLADDAITQARSCSPTATISSSSRSMSSASPDH
jgi:hypothetical protein